MNLKAPDFETMAITQADHFIKLLLCRGINTFFCVPGGAIEPLMNAISRSLRNDPKSINLVIARHETAAAFMADGYYRETGKIAAVVSTTGPGATNLVTGVASALAESIPMLIITAQTSRLKFGKKALQESSCTGIDTLGIFKNITKYNTLISHEEQIEHKLNSALLDANRVPFGPVHISFPSDIFNEKMPQRLVHKPIGHVRDGINVHALASFLSILRESNNFAIYVGECVGDSSKVIQNLVEKFNVPFVSSPMGKAYVNELHPLYHGVFGFAGHLSARNLMECPTLDFVLVIGSTLDELCTSSWSSSLINSRMIHLDSNQEHFSRSLGAKLHIYGDIRSSLEYIMAHCSESSWSNEKSYNLEYSKFDFNQSILFTEQSLLSVESSSPVKPKHLMSSLSRLAPDNSRFFIDAGNSWAWATHYLLRSDNMGLYRIGMGFGSMAWSVGAAIGSCFANKMPTFCIIGDGSFLMSSHEITVAVEHNLPIIFIVLNDSAMGMVMHGQKLGNQESIGWQLPDVNFAMIASACGVTGIQVNGTDDLKSLDFNDLFNSPGPVLIDVKIDRNEIPPMGDRIKGLSSASVTPGS